MPKHQNIKTSDGHKNQSPLAQPKTSRIKTARKSQQNIARKRSAMMSIEIATLKNSSKNDNKKNLQYTTSDIFK